MFMKEKKSIFILAFFHLLIIIETTNISKNLLQRHLYQMNYGVLCTPMKVLANLASL